MIGIIRQAHLISPQNSTFSYPIKPQIHKVKHNVYLFFADRRWGLASPEDPLLRTVESPVLELSSESEPEHDDDDDDDDEPELELSE